MIVRWCRRRPDDADRLQLRAFAAVLVDAIADSLEVGVTRDQLTDILTEAMMNNITR